MSLLDKLKALFNFEWKAPLININITNNSNNQEKSEKEYEKNEEKGNLDIYLDNLEDTKKKKLKEIVKEHVQEGNKFLEKNSSLLFKELCEFQKSKDNDKKVLDFFKNVLSEEDIEALECSLFLRREFNKRKDVGYMKQDIRTRFGDRGNNIANLCTAGYFEKFFIPLYNSSKEDFYKIYELAVSKSVLALFVHSQMSEDEIAEDIKSKLEISQKYGLKFFHIHGIGEQNIKTIKKCIEQNKEIFEIYNRDIFEDKGIIVVEIIL